MTGGPDVPGRVEITSKALTSLARAVAAEHLDVPAKSVRVKLGDWAGDLALDITGPVRIGTGLVARTAVVAGAISHRVSELTGRRVGAADIELTGIVHEHDSRVR